MPSLGTIIAIGVALVIGIGIATFFERRIERRKAAHSPTNPPPIPLLSVASPTSLNESSQIDTPPPLRPKARLKDRLRERYVSNKNVSMLLPSVQAELGDTVSMDDVIRAALQVGYAPADVAAFMHERQYRLDEIAGFLVEDASFDADQLADVLFPLTPGASVTERTETVLEAIKNASNVDDEDLLEVPTRCGCSPEQAAEVLYQNTDLRLAPILRSLQLQNVPLVAASLAKKLDVDLAEDDEYAKLREDDEMTFKQAALLLKECGKDAETILRAESSYSDLSEDDLDEVFDVLAQAGFSHLDILNGISQSEILQNADNATARIVEVAADKKVSGNDVAAFIKNEGIDLEDLEKEMCEIDIDFASRIDLLHALLHHRDTSPDEPPASSSDQSALAS